MVSRPKNLDKVGLFTWDSELMGRLGVFPCPRSERLDAEEGFREITILASPMQRESFCESEKSPVTSVLELNTRPPTPRGQMRLEKFKSVPRLCISSICLVGRCVRQCDQQEAKVLLLAPSWKSQFWYPLLLYSLFSLPVLLPSVMDLLSNPEGQNIHFAFSSCFRQ